MDVLIGVTRFSDQVGQGHTEMAGLHRFAHLFIKREMLLDRARAANIGSMVEQHDGAVSLLTLQKSLEKKSFIERRLKSKSCLISLPRKCWAFQFPWP
jgi:hypothetical protein